MFNFYTVFAIEATLTLTPSRVAPVCLGQQLDFACSASDLTLDDFVIWNVTLFENFDGREISDTRLISAAGQATVSPIVINI